MADNGSEFINDSAANETSISTYMYHGHYVVVPMVIIIILIIILAIGGNIMVILTILRHRGMRTRTNMFIVNLAVADILVAALDMPVSLVTIIKGDWIFTDAMCQLNAFTMALFLICSIHTLMYISIHKYISITRPFSRAMTPRRIKIMIAASWFWAAFCATGPILGWNHNTYKIGSSQCGPCIPRSLLSRSHSLLITFSNFIVPLSVMSFCYYRIFREIHVHMNRIRQTSNIDLENSVQQQKKVATTLFLVLSCFLLCWSPFIIYSNAAAFIKDKKAIPPITNPLAYWCGYLNSACNPIIYAFRSPSFRKGYKEIMCGASAAGLNTVNSMSFRSKSGRGSSKSTNNTGKIHRQRTMLSQTSWRSLPLMPTLIRSFSTKHPDRNSDPESPGTPDTPETPGCAPCGFWKSKPSSSYEVGRTEDDTSPSRKTSKVHSLQEIKEDEEVLSKDEKDLMISENHHGPSLEHCTPNDDDVDIDVDLNDDDLQRTAV